MNHVVLTRFNLPTEGVEGLRRAREGWLRKRVALFEQYCAPSVERQRGPLTWLVYFDPASPGWLLERISPFVDRNLFVPVMRETVTEEDLLGDISEAVGTRATRLLTSNVDNDDALATDFGVRLRSVERDHPQVAIYLTNGLIKSPAGLFLRQDRRNAFCSVLSTWDDPVTAWSQYHNELPRVMPVVEMGGPPGWLQVVHDDNVSNRVRGSLVSPSSYQARFPGVLADVAEPGRGARLHDGLVRRPTRELRDTTRAAARVVGLRLLGKNGYQTAKARFTTMTSTWR